MKSRSHSKDQSVNEMHSDYVLCPLLSCKGYKSKQVCYNVCDRFTSGKCDTIKLMWNSIGYQQTKKRRRKRNKN